MTHHALDGSSRQPVPGARAIGKADPSERLEVSVILRNRAAEALRQTVQRLAEADRPGGHLRREDFAQRFAAHPSDVAAVRGFANVHGLSVVQAHPARRTVVLSGTVRQFNAAFGVELQQFEHKDGTYRGRTGPVCVPDALKGVMEAVLGLDNRPAARPYVRQRQASGAGQGTQAEHTPGEFAALYGFPDGDGQGECVAIIELGGGYRAEDLAAYFAACGISPAPSVSAVSVDHARNLASGDPNGPDGEVMLDIEVVGAVAPAAKIVVYFAPNTDAGFVDAVSTAVHDAANRPSVISISWGGPEPTWTPQAMTALDGVFQAAAAMGITVCVAAGDNGSGDGMLDEADHADFPASSPHVLSCGGTSLLAANGAIASEVVWNDGAGGGAGGGGVSAAFPLPAWQEGLNVIRGGASAALGMRGVPDVSGNADPETGYRVRIDGGETVIGGTSAVAPLWAGLIARINAAMKSPVGFVNPRLYAAAGALRDITQGNNGDFSAGPGWDACTGLGSPNGRSVAAALGGTVAV
jgi:kumamolisin